MNIDYLCFAPHKGFYAPSGLGVLIAEKPINNILISGGTGVNSIDPWQPTDTPERLESGTQNISGILGLSAGVDFVNSKGIKRVEKYEYELIIYAYRELRKLNAELYTDHPEINEFSPVISFNLNGFTSEEIGAYLNKKGIAVRAGLHCAPLAHKQLGTIEKGTVRVSPSIYNSKSEIDNLIFNLKKII